LPAFFKKGVRAQEGAAATFSYAALLRK